MGAKAGRKGGRSYNIRTVGKGWWRKYLDKMRRGTARKAAIDEQETVIYCDEHGEPDCKCCADPKGCTCGYRWE